MSMDMSMFYVSHKTLKHVCVCVWACVCVNWNSVLNRKGENSVGGLFLTFIRFSPQSFHLLLTLWPIQAIKKRGKQTIFHHSDQFLLYKQTLIFQQRKQTLRKHGGLHNIDFFMSNEVHYVFIFFLFFIFVDKPQL